MSRSRIVIPLFACFVACGAALASHAHAQAPAPSGQPTPAVRTVSINTATAEELDSLPGIGPAKVEAIIQMRQRRPFRRITDLLRVSGIGRATLERLRPLVTFELPPPPVPR